LCKAASYLRHISLASSRIVDDLSQGQWGNFRKAGRKAPRRKRQLLPAFPHGGGFKVLSTSYINLLFPPPLPTFLFSSSSHTNKQSQSIFYYKQSTTKQTNQPQPSKWIPSRTPPTTSPSLSSRPVPPPPRRPTSRSPRTTTSPSATVPPLPRMPSATRSTSRSTTSRARATRSLPSTKSFP
ncbi:hypothetical protein CI238_02008, partial [Colletotrichum incanum]